MTRRAVLKVGEHLQQVGSSDLFSPVEEVVLLVRSDLAIDSSHSEETKIKKDYDGKIYK